MDYLGYGFGSSYGSGLPTIMGVGITAVIVTILSILAIIGLSIAGYISFFGKNAKGDNAAAKFFRFDKYYINKALKVLFMILAIVGFVVFVATVIMAVVTALNFSNAGAMLGTIFGAFFSGLIGLVVYLVVLRLCYEGMLIFIRQAFDVRALRAHFVKDVAPPSADEGDFSSVADASAGVAAPTPVATPAQPAPSAVATPTQAGSSAVPQASAPSAPATPAVVVESDEWVCSSCGSRSTDKFCFNCGKPRP